MSALDSHRPQDAETEDNSGNESVTYIEISSVDHPEAYSKLSSKTNGVIRRSADVDNLYADITNNLAPFFESEDALPMLEWILLNSEGEVKEDLLEEFLAEHGDE